jgi:hypothetical protein
VAGDVEVSQRVVVFLDGVVLLLNVRGQRQRIDAPTEQDGLRLAAGIGRVDGFSQRAVRIANAIRTVIELGHDSRRRARRLGRLRLLRRATATRGRQRYPDPTP